ncbi:hypothetical protein [Asticcacaulis solisilvae]|uniref:hypothetical protein n=1 Tax=Asticcacaulis solisilvae TaxID=1217274 RepID=UPI003FD6D9FB
MSRRLFAQAATGVGRFSGKRHRIGGVGGRQFQRRLGYRRHRLTGKWTGPEGTWLDIAPKGEGYRVTVSNLDGPRDFDGTADDGGIRFMRDGQTFVIRPGNGDDTGMKWLAGKKDCLIVAPGEGYCRG